MRVVLLLRGVNIGGVRIPMKDLAAALTEHGFADVVTVLASGNVVATVEEDPADAAAAAARVIRERFGHEIVVLGVPVVVMRAAVEEYPFPRAADRHAYVVFAERAEALAELLTVAGALDPAVERVQPGEAVLYWDAPKGETLTTAFGKHFGAGRRSGEVTTRNLNTLEKIVAVA